ncbi:hypothetical protein TorRG33x02_280120 [Trema orientale]|uniref:Uncharacterized protein n=1 Tax=Trema orientale TaxID=63057 RepID=A0A2P5CM56_TREOI|nr:hypothetical protein TorRG33x02_280120 [Trema orientale]
MEIFFFKGIYPSLILALNNIIEISFKAGKSGSNLKQVSRDTEQYIHELGTSLATIDEGGAHSYLLRGNKEQGLPSFSFYTTETATAYFPKANKLSQRILGLSTRDCSKKDCLKDLDKERKCSTNELMRCVQVALFPVQESVANRPAMSDVVSMLSSHMAILPDPKQSASSIPEEISDNNFPEDLASYSVNDVTVLTPES